MHVSAYVFAHACYTCTLCVRIHVRFMYVLFIHVLTALGPVCLSIFSGMLLLSYLLFMHDIAYYVRLNLYYGVYACNCIYIYSLFFVMHAFAYLFIHYFFAMHVSAYLFFFPVMHVFAYLFIHYFIMHDCIFIYTFFAYFLCMLSVCYYYFLYMYLLHIFFLSLTRSVYCLNDYVHFIPNRLQVCRIFGVTLPL